MPRFHEGKYLGPSSYYYAALQARKPREGKNQTLRKPQKEILFAPSTSAADAQGGELVGDDIRRRNRRLLLLVLPRGPIRATPVPTHRHCGVGRQLGALSPPPHLGLSVPAAPAADAIEVSDSSHSRYS